MEWIAQAQIQAKPKKTKDERKGERRNVVSFTLSRHFFNSLLTATTSQATRPFNWTHSVFRARCSRSWKIVIKIKTAKIKLTSREGDAARQQPLVHYKWISRIKLNGTHTHTHTVIASHRASHSQYRIHVNFIAAIQRSWFELNGVYCLFQSNLRYMCVMTWYFIYAFRCFTMDSGSYFCAIALALLVCLMVVCVCVCAVWEASDIN